MDNEQRPGWSSLASDVVGSGPPVRGQRSQQGLEPPPSPARSRVASRADAHEVRFAPETCSVAFRGPAQPAVHRGRRSRGIDRAAAPRVGNDAISESVNDGVCRYPRYPRSDVAVDRFRLGTQGQLDPVAKAARVEGCVRPSGTNGCPTDLRSGRGSGITRGRSAAGRGDLRPWWERAVLRDGELHRKVRQRKESNPCSPRSECSLILTRTGTT